MLLLWLKLLLFVSDGLFGEVVMVVGVAGNDSEVSEFISKSASKASLLRLRVGDRWRCWLPGEKEEEPERLMLGDSSTIFGSEPRLALWPPASVVAEEAFALLLMLVLEGGRATIPIRSMSLLDDAPPPARNDSLKFNVEVDASPVPAELLNPLFRKEENKNLPLLLPVADLLPPALELSAAPLVLWTTLLAGAAVVLTFSAGRKAVEGSESGLHQRSSDSFSSITNDSKQSNRSRNKKKCDYSTNKKNDIPMTKSGANTSTASGRWLTR